MASFPSLSEQFIQDVVSRPDRLVRMLKEQAVGRESWFFDPDETEGDVVNQEYTVGAGRIDVIATFARRTKLLIVETKAGIADFAALDQLKWYLEPEQLAALRRDKQLSDVCNDNVVGFLVAQDFSGIPPQHIPANIHLFRCIITDAREQPMLKHVLPGSLPESAACDDEAAPKPKRGSQLTRLPEHINYIGSNNRLQQDESQRLREDFCRFLRCFLEQDDANRWVHPNPKGGYIWVHYKGVQLIHLQAARKWFDVQYGLSPKSLRITADTSVATIRECEEVILRDLKEIDDDFGKLFGNA
jgi:hypothetical protein